MCKLKQVYVNNTSVHKQKLSGAPVYLHALDVKAATTQCVQSVMVTAHDVQCATANEANSDMNLVFQPSGMHHTNWCC